MKAVILFMILGISCYAVDSNKAMATDAPAKKSFTVVELFTSEGCSSCPPADELVKNIVNEQHDNVYVLSYHVDYWNRLGWKDVFSKAAFSERQRHYAEALSLEGVYTPQIVVNGTEEFVGSNEMRLRSSIKNMNGKASDLVISTAKKTDQAIHITYSGAGRDVLLNIALVQPKATTDVKRGENSGRQLEHVNIVRELVTRPVEQGEGMVDVTIPAELQNTPLEIIAFTQNKNTLQVTGVAQAALPE